MVRWTDKHKYIHTYIQKTNVLQKANRDAVKCHLTAFITNDLYRENQSYFIFYHKRKPNTLSI